MPHISYHQKEHKEQEIHCHLTDDDHLRTDVMVDLEFSQQAKVEDAEGQC